MIRNFDLTSPFLLICLMNIENSTKDSGNTSSKKSGLKASLDNINNSKNREV